MSVRIELLNKPISKWTKKEAVIESIKLWSFLAEDGNKTKFDYFDDDNAIHSNCFLCAYYFNNKRLKYKKKHPEKPDLSGDEVCKKFKCCLNDISLCQFNIYDSAYSIWLENDDSEVREEAAEIILNALKEEYKKITGEEYHE